MKFLSFFIGIFLTGALVLPVFAEDQVPSDNQDFIFQEKDLYTKIYEQLGNDFAQGSVTTARKSLERASSMVGTSPEMYASAMQSTTGDAVKICGLKESTKEVLSTDALVDCQKKLQNLYSEEYDRNFFEWRLQYDALAREAWMNGSLLDGSFDLVVDLNVIDLVLFGKKATVPSGPSPLWDNNSGEDDASIPAAEESAGEASIPGAGAGGSTPGVGANGNGKPTNTADAKNTSQSSGSATPSGGGGEGLTAPTGATGNTEESQTGQICQDPDALFFKDSTGPSENGGAGGNTAGGTGGASGRGGATGAGGKTGTGSNNSMGGASSQRSREALQSGSAFEMGKYGYLGGSYLDFDSILGAEKTCEGEEIPLFGGMVCVPKFCSDILCLRITIIPGYRAVTDKQNLDCVECSVDRGLEVVRKLYGLTGKLTPNDAPTRNFFLTAFKNLFRNVTSSITVISKPLPFLVYKTQNDPTPSTKTYPDDETEKPLSKEEQKKAEEKSYYDQNKKLSDGIDRYCQSKISAPRGKGQQLSVVDACISDEDFSNYVAGYSQKPVSASGDSISGVLAGQRARSSFFHDVVLPGLAQMQQSVETINAHFLSMQAEKLLENLPSCKSKN